MTDLLQNIIRYGSRNILFAFILVLLSGTVVASPDDVVVIGDERLEPVQEVIAGLEETIGKKVTIVSPDEAHENLSAIVSQHHARVVIALGKKSIQESLVLPTSIQVLYSLVILPPDIDRPNICGVYMGTPIREYVKMVATYMPDLKNISVISSPQVFKILDNDKPQIVKAYEAYSSYEFVKAMKKLESTDALLLLPDIALLTKKAMEEIFLYSFRNKVPLLGISKNYVRNGALFALQFDTTHIGQHLGQMTMDALAGKQLQNKAVPATHFNLFVNKATAKKMGITIPEKMLKTAAAVYP